MNLMLLATRDVRANPGQAFLAAALSALAVAMLVVLLAFTGQMTDRLQRDARDIDLVVGAKGSPLQLILAGVYHLDVPPGNIPLQEVEVLAHDPLVRRLIPIALGDSFRGFRIVGAPTAYGELYQATLATGHWYADPLEAVLGAEVAARTGLTVEKTFAGSHGLTAGGHVHADMAYTVTGVLQPTGTVLDRLILTPVESVWWVHADHTGGEETFDHPEVTLALIQYRSPLAAVSLPRRINAQTALMAASPPLEIARLTQLMGVGQEVLQGFAWLLFVAAGGALLAGLLANLRHRRYELAIFRLLGASRGQLWAGVMIEAWLLATLGAVAGLLLGHGWVYGLGWWLAMQQQPVLDGTRFMAWEGWLVVLAWGIAWLAAAWPAWRASRLDVARVLAER
ncbi:MAG: ABC transporter permease [Magnetococcales bacterium]|nr:ABC transporter permease [Magnetococcales bacterium]